MCLPAALFVSAALLGGCGGGDGGSGKPVERADSAPAAPAGSFPQVGAGDNGIEQVLRNATTGGPEFAPSVSVLTPGENRIGFGLFNKQGVMTRESAVALYIARADGTGPKGPYPARRESLKVPAAFESQQTATEETPYVYVTSVPFVRPGRYGVVAVVKRGGKLLASTPAPITVGKPGSGPPGVGQTPPRITTLTPKDVGGDLSRLTTRKPPLRSLVSTNFAEVLGGRPVVLGFATPQLCQTRICGPVVDIMAEMQSRYGKQVEFIQQEVYVDNDPSKGLRPQLVRFRLQTEPWTYVIDRYGKIAARFEGAFSSAELDAAVRGVAP